MIFGIMTIERKKERKCWWQVAGTDKHFVALSTILFCHITIYNFPVFNSEIGIQLF